jgi:hypothetical protein
MKNFKKNLQKQIKGLSKADIHIHSNYSDGHPTIEEILKYTQEKTDIDVIAITDHDTTDGAIYALELAKKKKYRFEIIVGEEVSSKEGHIIGLFLKETIPPSLSAHDTIKMIHAQGGIAIAAHPLYHSRMNNHTIVWADGVGTQTLLKEKNHFDAIETVNATPTLGEENLHVKYLNRLLLFRPETGSSDAHIVQAIGKGFTLFEGKTAEAFKTAVIKHQTQAINEKWNFMGIMRYAFFFLPKGLRTTFYTILWGKRKKRPEIINFPSMAKIRREIADDFYE